MDSGGSALAGANGITIVVQVPAQATRLGVVGRGVPHPPFLALAAQSGGFEVHTSLTEAAERPQIRP